MSRQRGLFITVEGVDGAGKSTQLAWLAQTLRSAGVDLLESREPGGTPLGEQLRALLLNQPMHLQTEALLMFAARNEHIVQVIEPALAAGRWVLCDRFTDASYAYQGGGRGLAQHKLAQLENWVQGEGESALQPDLTLVFDLPWAVSQARLSGQRVLDKFEQEGAAFFERVRNAYLQRAAAAPQRIRLIDANRSIGAIQDELAGLVHALLLRSDGAKPC